VPCDLEEHRVLVVRVRTSAAGAETVDARELAGRPVREIVAAEHLLAIRVEPEHPVGS